MNAYTEPVTNPTLINVYSQGTKESRESVTNKITEELRGTGYSAASTTLEQAKKTYKHSNWKNCIEYALTIQDVLKKNGVDSQIEIVKGGYEEHAIIRFEENGKIITYSNGKIVPNMKYSGNGRIVR